MNPVSAHHDWLHHLIHNKVVLWAEIRSVEGYRSHTGVKGVSLEVDQ